MLAAFLGVCAAKAQEYVDGGVVRGPKGAGAVALEFTGHEFAEGGETILDQLRQHGAKASFFLTGDFLRDHANQQLIRRIIREGHYLGPHSDKHLLYCAWETGKRTLITREEFRRDLEGNLREIKRFGLKRNRIGYWIPAYEWYNPDIVQWSSEMGLELINFTPGTGSNADYTVEAESNFVSSDSIVARILNRERTDPDGLNGFLLLMHIGAGPGRKDKMHDRLGELLSALAAKGYRFVRVDKLLKTGVRDQGSDSAPYR